MKRNTLVCVSQSNPGTIEFRRKDLSALSRRTYETSVNQYFAYLQKHDLKEGIPSVETWIEGFRNPNTRMIRFHALKEYLLKRYEDAPPEQRLELREFLDRVSRRKLERPERRVLKEDYLSREEIELLCEQIEQKEFVKDISLVIQALFWTGCRVSELTGIRLEDCAANGEVRITVLGKGKRWRHVYLPKALFEKIVERYRGKDLLFADAMGERITRQCLSEAVRRMGWKYLGKKISAHTLRHSMAMYLKNERGLSADQIAKYLGHANVVVTLKFYFHGTPGPCEIGLTSPAFNTMKFSYFKEDSLSQVSIVNLGRANRLKMEERS